MQLDEPSWISVQPQNHAVFDALVSFIESASSDPDNLQHLADSTIITLLSAGSQDPSVDQYRLESRILFATVFTVIKQLDAAAVRQDHLIKLVLSLRDVPLPPTVTQEIAPGDLDDNINEDLSKLINVFSDFERDAPLHPRLEDRANYAGRGIARSPWRLEPGETLTAGEWANVNAFLARLHTAAPDVARLDVRGLFAMIEALEQPLTSSQLDDVLPAAAYWIIYGGNELRGNDIPYAFYDDDGGSRRLPYSRGQLWNGQHAFNQARWEFWMQRFKDVAERTDVSDGVRGIALRALEAGAL